MVSKTKKFYFGVYWTEYGTQTIDVPANFTLKEAERYVKDHWDKIELPEGDYVTDSDEPDFENSSFEEE